MTRNDDNSVHIGDSRIAAGNIGGSDNSGTLTGTVHQTDTTADELTTTLEQLRVELRSLRGHLADTESTDAEPADVDDLIEALDEQPDMERVTSRWTRLLRRIPESLTDLDGIGRIIDLIQRLQQLN